MQNQFVFSTTILRLEASPFISHEAHPFGTLLNDVIVAFDEMAQKYDVEKA